MGRCLRIFASGVFHIRGLLAGLSLTSRRRWQSGDLKAERLGTDLCSRAATGLISGGEETALRAAVRCRCSIKRGSGGRQDSMARMGMGVEEKQFVTHLWILLQNTSSLSCIFKRGVNRSAPYSNTGAMREEARRWQR